MKPKPFWELKNFTVPVAILASLKRTNTLDRTTIRASRYPDLACSWERPVVGRCKPGEISNAAHIGLVPTVCNDDLVVRIASHLSCSPDFGSDNLDDLRIGLSGPNGVADFFAEQRARHRRNMRERAARGIGLVFADDPKGLAASIVAYDGHGRAEMHARRVFARRRKLSAGAPRIPVAQLARRPRDRAAVTRRLGSSVLALQARELILDLGEALRRHQIGMQRNLTVRQFRNCVFAVRLFDECPAHDGNSRSFRFVNSVDPTATSPHIWIYGTFAAEPYAQARLPMEPF